MGGVALIQVPAQDPTLQAAKAEQAGLGDNKQKLVGLAAVFAACLSSGQYIFFQNQYKYFFVTFSEIITQDLLESSMKSC